MRDLYPTDFSGAAALIWHNGRMVFEVRKEKGWERSPGKPAVIGIGAVGGTIEDGETPIQGLQREAVEEIGGSLNLYPASDTVYVGKDAIDRIDDFVLDGLRPALVWEVVDPIYELGKHVAVYHATTTSDPQPGDLPAVILSDPDLITRIGFDTLSISAAVDSSGEVRSCTDFNVPSDGHFLLCNTLRRMMQVHEHDPDVYESLVQAPTT